MKKTITLIALGLAASASFSFAELRTWTSASDASKQFKAELIAASDTQITVRREDGQEMTFPLSVVTKADQDFVAAARPNLAPIAENKVHKELSSSMGRGTVSSGAEYYIIYAAASF